MDREEKIRDAMARYELEMRAIEEEYRAEVATANDEFNQRARLIMENMYMENLECRQRVLELRFGLGTTARSMQIRQKWLHNSRTFGRRPFISGSAE